MSIVHFVDAAHQSPAHLLLPCGFFSFNRLHKTPSLSSTIAEEIIEYAWCGTRPRVLIS